MHRAATSAISNPVLILVLPQLESEERAGPASIASRNADDALQRGSTDRRSVTGKMTGEQLPNKWLEWNGPSVSSGCQRLALADKATA
jgi:hypothetical protein